MNNLKHKGTVLLCFHAKDLCFHAKDLCFYTKDLTSKAGLLVGLHVHASEPIRTTVVDTPYRGGVLCLMWGIRHTEAGYYANVVGYYACCCGYAIQRRGIMLTWWGIMLDVVDTPYRGGVLCLRGGALCSASVWRIHHIKHNTPPR